MIECTTSTDMNAFKARVRASLTKRLVEEMWKESGGPRNAKLTTSIKDFGNRMSKVTVTVAETTEVTREFMDSFRVALQQQEIKWMR